MWVFSVGSCLFLSLYSESVDTQVLQSRNLINRSNGVNFFVFVAFVCLERVSFILQLVVE